ncbi:MAG: hypothetical protein LBR70_00625 [Lactobacillaceae bacterium]|jgi:hypothetical protein|nr:hypothetical protein [Lactobacillaceae bacterium]
MRLLFFVLAWSLIFPTLVSAQYFGNSADEQNSAASAQAQKPAWSGMNNPRAVRTRAAQKAPVWGNSADKATAEPVQNSQTVQRQQANTNAPAADIQTEELPTPRKFIQPTNARGQKIPPLDYDTVISISERRGNALTWQDFDNYPYEESDEDTGYISRRYELVDGYALILGGPDLDYEPRYIYITDGGIIVIKSIKGY